MANKLGPAKIIYKGPSHLPGAEGQEIVALIAFGSENGKTGDVWTIFYFPASVLDIEVNEGGLLEHLLSGADSAVCLGCIHGSKGDRDCYTFPQMFKGNRSMIKSLQRRIAKGQNVYLSNDELYALIGKYEPLIRLGGYGDPVAAPLKLSQGIVAAAKGQTLGYTHVWNRIPLDDRAYYQAFLMASVDTPMQGEFARAKGWRTFRVGQEDLTSDKKAEFNCPASKEMLAKIGKEITCADCKQCKGTSADASKSTYIKSHGAFSNRYKPLNVLATV